MIKILIWIILIIFPITRKLLFGKITSKFKKKEAEKNNLVEVIESGWISEGKFCRKCETFLANML